MKTAILESEQMQRLVTLVEQATRSTKDGVKNFVPPAQGVLERVLSKRHHIVFGRRGSGKSSLLEKAAADLTVDRRPIAKVDLETFKGHSYPDVLLSVLIRTFEEFRNWLQSAAIHPANKLSFWNRWFGTRPTRPAFNRNEANQLATALTEKIEGLKQVLHSADAANLSVVHSAEDVLQQGEKLSGGVSKGPVQFGGESSNSEQHKASSQVTESFSRSKTDYLHRHILEYQDIFRRMSSLSQGDSFLLLDDLYHIRRADQAMVLDYFHRIAKGNSLWLKVGTIRHRTSWYRHGDPPIGVKLGDDAEDINLDLTLEKYALAKEFLLKVLGNFATEVGLGLDDFLTDGARDRLVLASGGVARDFLSIFRRSVDIARERQGGPRGEKIGGEDVNMASGEYDSSKREEFKRDTSGDEDALNQEFERIRNFCLEEAETNCFIMDVNALGREVELIHELVDLKLLHLVRSRVTVGNAKYKGQIFQAYMLDLSQYTGARKRREFRLVEFWKKDANEDLRRASLIYEPDERASPKAGANEIE